jgi:hypothetical protein
VNTNQHSVYAALADALARSRDISELYRSWWAGCDGDAAFDQPDPEYYLEPRRHPTERWNLVKVLPDGTACVARGGESGQVPAGSWLAWDTDTVSVSQRSQWVENGFLWCASARPRSAIVRRWRVRIYIPASREDPDKRRQRLLRICDALEEEGVWFEAKVWLGGPPRRDHTVLWVKASDAEAVVCLLDKGGFCSSSSWPVPPTTLPLLDCAVGLAHDPVSEDSLGLLVCSAVVAVGDLSPSMPLRERWHVACRHFGLSPDTPWRHPGQVDPYGLWTRLEEQWA